MDNEKFKREFSDYYFQIWIQKVQKKILIEEYTEHQDTAVLSLFILSMNAARCEIDLVKKDSNYQEILTLIKHLTHVNLEILKDKFLQSGVDLVNKINDKISMIEKEILGNKKVKQIENIISSAKTDVEKKFLVEKIKTDHFDSSAHDKIEFLEELKDAKEKFHLAMDMIELDKLNKDILDCNQQFHENIAYLVYNPEILLTNSLILYDEWVNFPLKWYFYLDSISELREVFFKYCRQGNMEFYFDEKIDGLIASIESLIKNKFTHKYLQDRYQIIEEILLNYNDGRYASSLVLALTTIEGLIWDFASIVNTRSKTIFDSSGDMINYKTKISFSSNKVKELIRNTDVKKYILDEFIIYFCEELYEERNPIVHGRDINSFKKNVVEKKLFVIEFLMKIINSFHTETILEMFNEQKGMMENAKVEIRKYLTDYTKK